MSRNEREPCVGSHDVDRGVVGSSESHGYVVDIVYAPIGLCNAGVVNNT